MFKIKPVAYVVEPDFSNRKYLEALLQFEGYHVVAVDSSHDALEQMQEILPEVVLITVNVTDRYRSELNYRLRSNPKTQHIPIIAISAALMPSQEHQIIESGYDLCLCKPIQAPILLQLLNGFNLHHTA